jgi:hypothetical protein
VLPNEREELLYIRGLKGAALVALRCGGQIADPEKIAFFPNPRVLVIGADHSWIAPGVDRNKAIGKGRGDVHRAAVDTDREARPADEPDELQDGGVIEQVDAVIWDGYLALTSTDDDDAVRGESVTELFHRKVTQGLALAAGEGVKENERLIFIEALDSIARRQREAQGALHWNAKRPNE